MAKTNSLRPTERKRKPLTFTMKTYSLQVGLLLLSMSLTAEAMQADQNPSEIDTQMVIDAQMAEMSRIIANQIANQIAEDQIFARWQKIKDRDEHTTLIAVDKLDGHTVGLAVMDYLNDNDVFSEERKQRYKQKIKEQDEEVTIPKGTKLKVFYGHFTFPESEDNPSKIVVETMEDVHGCDGQIYSKLYFGIKSYADRAQILRLDVDTCGARRLESQREAQNNGEPLDEAAQRRL